MINDHMQTLGCLVLGSRMKRLSDCFMQDVKRYYVAQGVPFEPKWFSLFTLVAAQPEISLAEAAGQLHLTHSAISQLASQMEKVKLIAIHKSKTDERAKRLVLTTKGKAMQEQMEPVWGILRGAVDDVLREAGVPMLDLLEKVETAFQRQGVFERAMEQAQPKTARREILLVPYEAGNLMHRHAFAALNREWLERYFSIEPEDERLFASPEETILAPGGYIIFAQVDGELVGTAALVKREDGYEFSKMAVSPRYQGLGLGRKIAEGLIAQAREIGLPFIRLMSNTALQPAIRLYESLGFKVIPLNNTLYVRSNIAMRLDLTPAMHTVMAKSA